ncbi:MAG: hypothetical protein ACXVHD_29225 [Solirubrobacteraceae bacterium]
MTERQPEITSGRSGRRASRTDRLVAEQERAAAADAARIGGVVPPVTDGPAMEPLYEAGEGEEDGWELAEVDLIENATHGEGHGDPKLDAFPPEPEADRATVAYGESDEIHSTERDGDISGDEGRPGRS